MLEDILKSGNYSLVDVREPMELEMDGEFDNAINIPLGEIEERKEEILSLENPVVLFCKSGNRSGRALEFLEANGLKNGYNGGGFAHLKSVIESL
ncbi:MAG: rhodanese-like domain-containing protein [Bacteroidetes bacterium]|jgi:rhodanese-related sulfurtransferase|nr:rhodanese-like domain-containing protein [Bacteroidota bacterium]